jgi:serine/threonine protein kinase/tetratricopeptide (TPR) repeat protein
VNPGDTIGRYRITGRIGQGGMGVVYRAEDTRLLRPVALKFLPRDSLDESRKIRFLNEARAAALARHPNICPIHDIEQADGELFIVMALIEGETLARRIARGRLGPAEAADISAQVAAGLACAHDLGIVHRDIKSSNIMVDSSGHASIMDFGLALAPEALRLTGEGASVGTPDYMSPEQAMGNAVDARSDLWSLGVVLFEMLTGRLPFHREHRGALAHAILNDPVPEMPGVPEELQRIVGRALVKDPAGRWPSAAAMLRALKGAQTQPAIDDAPTDTIIVPVARPRRLPRAAIPPAVLVLLAAAAFAVHRWRTSSPSIPPVPQIAVLPFEAAGASAVADGLDAVLTTALAAQPSVTVVPSSDLRRRSITTVEAARKFYNVNLAIAASAKPSGGRVELTVNLIDAAKDRPIAARTLLYDPKNPIVSRDQAVGQVFGMLNLAPPPASAGETPAGDAYSAYLEGRGLLARYDIPGNIDKAIAAFQRATAQDAKFALAYAGLGEAYWRKARASGEKEAATLASQNAGYATQLDPGLAIAHSVLGSVYFEAGRRDDAVREFQRAMQLAPGNAEAPRQLAEIYTTLARFDEAESLYLRSTKARPTDWYGHLLLGVFYINRERYPEAEAELAEARTLTPDNDMVRRALGGAMTLNGRYKEAVEEYERALRIRTTAGTYARLAEPLFYQHRFQEAVSAGEAAIDLDSTDYRYWGNLGVYYRWSAGNEAKAVPALRRAIELGLKVAETRKSDYNVVANLSEYRARLGQAKESLALLDQIPVTARGPLASRLAIVYELTGNHAKAIDMIRSNLKSASSWNTIKDHPDLAAVWRDAKLR